MWTPVEKYLHILENYLAGHITAQNLQDVYFAQWRADRDYERVLCKPQEGRSITEDEFRALGVDLEACEIISSAFSAIDFYCDDDFGQAPGGVESADGLRKELEELARRLRDHVSRGGSCG